MKLLNLEQFLMTVETTNIEDNKIYLRVQHIDFSYPYELYIQAEFTNVFDDIYSKYIECFEYAYIECLEYAE